VGSDEEDHFHKACSATPRYNTVLLVVLFTASLRRKKTQRDLQCNYHPCFGFQTHGLQ
jgi:hypothetical protein